jgi:exodeoxyribonuclease-1
MTSEQLEKADFNFSDNRLSEMLFRYRARNYPSSLNAKEQLRWDEFCKNRLTGYQAGAGITLEAYRTRLQELRALNITNMKILDALDAYAIELYKA